MCYESYCPQSYRSSTALDEDDNSSKVSAFTDSPDEPLSAKSKEVSAFKEAMLKCKVVLQKDGERRVELYKSADRRLDIDLLKLFSDNFKGFPCLATGTRKTARAEKLVLTAS